MRQGWFVRTLLLALVTMIPMQGIRPLVSYRALEMGASALDLGVIAGSYALLSFVFAAPVGRWMDRFGEPRFLIAGTGLVSLTAIALAQVDSIPALIVAQAVLGLGQVTMLVGVQTVVANGGGREGRDGRFGVFTVVGSLSQMIGPVTAGFLYGTLDMPLSRVFLLGAVPAALGTVLAVTLFLRPPERLSPRGSGKGTTQEPFFRSVGYVMRQPSIPHAMLASLTVLTTIDLLVAYLPAYGEANGIPASTIGLLLGARAATGMFSRLLMTWLLHRSTRRRVLVQSMLLAAVSLLALPLTTEPLVLLVLLSIAGFGLGLGQPLSMSWIADSVPRSIRGMALGVRITGNRLAQLVIPLAVGAVAGATGIGAIFVTSGALLGLSSVGVARAPTDGTASRQGDDTPR